MVLVISQVMELLQGEQSYCIFSLIDSGFLELAQLSTRSCSSTFGRLLELSFYIMCGLTLDASCSKSQFLDEYVVFQSLPLYRRTYLQVHCIIVHALQGHCTDNVLDEGAGLTRRCCQLLSLFLHRQTLRPSWLRTRCRCHVAIATTQKRGVTACMHKS